MGVRGQSLLQTGTPDIVSGIYQNGAIQSPTIMNSIVGCDIFYTYGYLGTGRIIANVESGLVWGEHDTFNNPGSSPTVALTLVGTGALNQVDYHATMVGQVLAGTGYYVSESASPQYSYLGLGIAPHATLWSGAIATGYTEDSATGDISFNTTTESTVSVYRTFFQGIGSTRPDVINSSWGGADLQSPEMLAIEGLAHQNPTVAFVASAGNGGNASVSAPGSAFNGITAGSIGGASFLVPSSFSTRGPADFYNPVTNTTLTGVRAAVDIAAPGEDLFLAAYLGKSGTLAASTDPNIIAALQDSPPTGRFFTSPQSGTSFSAPIVAGGITLLKDVAATYFGNGTPTVYDTRVIKSVLMAGATETVGWNNGQSVNGDGAILTTQALDYATGAGALNLDSSVAIYVLSGTSDVAGSGGGAISKSGWDFATVGRSQANDYQFTNPFETPVELTVSLNWFAGSSFNNTSGLGENLSFSDLNLQVWTVVNGTLTTLVAESASIYNNAEFLRLDLPAGTYALRITFNGVVYETVPDSVTAEQYGLAWQAVPEPASILLLIFAGAVIGLKVRRMGARGVRQPAV